MFFSASKLAWMVAVPSTFLVLAAVLGLALMWRWRRLGMGLVALGVVGLLAIGLGPFGRLLTVPLEDRFPIFVDGQCVGGIGASGGNGEQDIACCEAGIAAFTATLGK